MTIYSSLPFVPNIIFPSPEHPIYKGDIPDMKAYIEKLKMESDRKNRDKQNDHQ